MQICQINVLNNKINDIKYANVSKLRKIKTNLKFYRTSAGKSTFRPQNDTDKAKFRCSAGKKYFTLSTAVTYHKHCSLAE